MPTDLNSLFERLRHFRGSWVSRGWSWDRRLDCVASTFDIVEAAQARTLISSVLTDEWTRATLSNAPPLIADVAESSGGVRSDQLLFATPDAPVMAYGLWWPWGGGASTISMRLGLVGRISERHLETLREVFGAPDT